MSQLRERLKKNRSLTFLHRYCRSYKYHDKAVDALHYTGNGYMITASMGSKFIKVWRIKHSRGKK